MMQVLVPIVSKSLFFPREEFYFSKPIVEVAGKPMIQLVAEQLKLSFEDATFIFVVDKEDVIEFSIDKILKQVVGNNCTIIVRNAPTKGALCSCLLAVDWLNPNLPLVIVNGDQVITENLANHCEKFIELGVDAGVLSFDSSHPRWSYALIDEANIVTQLAEKKVISRNAVAGFYYFAKAFAFLEAAKNAILNDARVDGNFFISASINEIIMSGAKVSSIKIEANNYHSFYSPARIDAFEKTFFARKFAKINSNSEIQVIIPAAGEGSRFAKANWKKPKPFIDVNGEMMISRVINNVCSRESKKFVLLRKEHIEKYPESIEVLGASGVQILPVEKLTEGTACTILLARKFYDNNRPLLIANSDQLVDFDVNDFVNDCLKRNLDGSILVFRDPLKDPKWSFVKTNDNGLVVEVAEKKPISDLATVGIYLFIKGSDFVSAAVDMIAKNDRVNDEFYTCPVYNYMIANGARIGVYEIPFEAMHGLGIPEDLERYLNTIGVMGSLDQPSN